MSQQVLEGYRLSRQQRRWLELYEQGERLRVCGRIRVSGEVELDQLARALEQTVQRHEALRTSFHALPGMELPLQVIGNACGYELEREAGSQSFVEWCAAEQNRAGTGLRVVAKGQEVWVGSSWVDKNL